MIWKYFRQKDVLWTYTSGWISNLKRYRLKSDGLFARAKDMYTEFGDLQVTEREYVSEDGVKVPISIIHNPDYKGKGPTIMVTYGTFGEKLTPGFSPLYLPWVAHSETLVYPHIRGGGEKGVDWYEAGKKSTKRNSWLDIIAAAEFHLKKDYASAEGIVLMPPSGGGVAVGMAINEAPVLFAGRKRLSLQQSRCCTF